MSILGNILWIVCGGLLVSMLYIAAGLLMCITIIGIPFGVQLFKIGVFALCPFGNDVHYDGDAGCLSTLFNVLWILFGWWEIALVHLVLAVLCAVTIIGIPFAVQHFKIIKLSFLPFGTSIA